MLNLNKYTKKLNQKLNQHSSLRTAHNYVCVYNCEQMLYIIQFRTVLTVFPPILQAFTIAQKMSNGGDEATIGKLWLYNSVANCPDSYHHQMSFTDSLPCAIDQPTEKGKENYLYSASLVCHTHKALRHGSHSFTCKLHHACLSL